MSGIRISDLPAANAAGLDDQIEVNQGGVSRSLTLAQVAGARDSAATVYVSTAGNAGNDGMDAATPVATCQQALDICAAIAATRPGSFVIQLAAGTYTEPLVLAYAPERFIGSPVTFKGAVDAGGVPTVIVLGSTDGTRTHDFYRATHSVRVVAQDIKFISFRAPFASGHGSDLSLNNIHTRNCLLAVSLGNGGWADVSGGLFDGRDLDGVVVPDSAGLSAVIGSFWDMRQPDDFSGLRMHHIDRGVVAGECASGHMDNLWIEDCRVGVELVRTAGAANMTGIRIWRCEIGILARNMTNLTVSDNADFGQGTANANGTDIVRTDGPTAAAIENTNYDSRLIYKRALPLPSGARRNTIAEFEAFKPYSIIKGRMRERDLVAQFNVIGIIPDAALVAAATMRLKFGATTVRTWTLPIGTTQFWLQGTITAINSTDIIGNLMMASGDSLTMNWTPLSISTTVNAVSRTVDTDMTLTAQLADLADSFQIRQAHCFTSIAGFAG